MRAFIPVILLLSAPLAALAQTHSNAPMMVVGGDSTAAPAPTPTTPTPTATSPAPLATTPATAAAPIASNPLPPNFPKAAITSIGETVGGEKTETPASPASPTPPANAASVATPANPQSPAAPAAPVNPVSKLWPRDTVPIFMTSCVGFHPQKIAPCSCVITQLMLAMGHDEFLAKSEDGTIEQDARLQRIRMECATAPQKKD